MIAAAALLEQALRAVALGLKQALDLRLDLGDIKGSLMERFRKYVRGLACLDLDVPEAQWRDISAVYEIRNCLVHAGGDLSRFAGSQAVRAFAQPGNLAFVSDGRIELDRVSATRLVAATSLFLNQLYRALLLNFPGPNEVCMWVHPQNPVPREVS